MTDNYKKHNILGYLRRKVNSANPSIVNRTQAVLTDIRAHVNAKVTNMQNERLRMKAPNWDLPWEEVDENYVEETPLSKESKKELLDVFEINAEGESVVNQNKYNLLADELKEVIEDNVVVSNKTRKRKVRVLPPLDDSPPIVPRKKVNKGTHLFRVNKQLLYHLKIKYFLKPRDASLMQLMVHEARLWLLKNGHSCDNLDDYIEMTSSVTIAYLVSKEEMIFRKTIKEQHNIDNMFHLNRTLAGNLGRTNKLNPLGENKSLETKIGLTRDFILPREKVTA